MNSLTFSYDIIYNKGYQVTDTVSSTVTTKVKGLGFINLDQYGSNISNQLVANDLINKFNQGDRFRVFDTTDYIIPGLLEN